MMKGQFSSEAIFLRGNYPHGQLSRGQLSGEQLSGGRLSWGQFSSGTIVLETIKMTVYFINSDDLILFHFNMKKLNIFNFLHINMMKVCFEIIRHHCFVLATTRNLQTCVCFYINIRLNKNKSQVLHNKT